jgi:hypothetical protein
MSQEEIKDLGIGDILKTVGNKGKGIGGSLKEVIKKKAINIKEEESLQLDNEYIEVMYDTHEITKSSRGLIVAATVIGPFAGPMAVMFSVDMDETQFKIIFAVLVANAIASVITAYINDLNLRSTAKNVARTAYYKFKNKFTSDEKDKQHITEKNTTLLAENTELKKQVKELDKYKLREAVEKEIKDRNLK